MAIQNNEFRKIINSHFSSFCTMVTSLININNVLSDLKKASKDNKNNVFLYNDTRINLECIEPDDISSHFSNYMKTQRKATDFEQPKAVDALCIDKNNNLYMIEFKNRELYKSSDDLNYGSEIRKDLKDKMLGTLWMLLSMNSMAQTQLFGSDVIEFARQHITYIIVISSQKNIKEYTRIKTCQSMNMQYTPAIYKKYKGYYVKDVLMITERELPKFIDHFKV